MQNWLFQRVRVFQSKSVGHIHHEVEEIWSGDEICCSGRGPPSAMPHLPRTDGASVTQTRSPCPPPNGLPIMCGIGAPVRGFQSKHAGHLILLRFLLSPLPLIQGGSWCFHPMTELHALRCHCNSLPSAMWVSMLPYS